MPVIPVRQGGILALVMAAHLLAITFSAAKNPLDTPPSKPMMLIDTALTLPHPERVLQAPSMPAPPVKASKANISPMPAPIKSMAETVAATPTASTPPSAATDGADTAAAPPSSSQGSSHANRPEASRNIAPAIFDADYLKNPFPSYPSAARRAREEGKVELRVFVTADGLAGQVEIKSSSGSSRLDDSALRTVRHWKFTPARRATQAEASWVIVPIVFKLES